MSAHERSTAMRHRRRLGAVMAIGVGILFLQIAGGVLANSLALIADSAHVFTDVAGVGLALAAVWFASRPATGVRTFGFYRLEVLAAVANAIVLFALSAWILIEAWHRFLDPPAVAGPVMLVVATVGLLANLAAVLILRPSEGESLNMRGAYLEVLGDAMGSGAVLLSALVISLTGLRQADALASAFIAVLIVPRTWGLLRDAVDVLLEATPKGVDMEQVRRHVLEAPGVRDVHDLHAWTITSGLNVLSAHVVIDRSADAQRVLDHVCRCLSSQFDFEHSTIQIEHADRRPAETLTHA